MTANDEDFAHTAVSRFFNDEVMRYGLAEHCRESYVREEGSSTNQPGPVGGS
jgi:hypothetical protein